MPEHTLVFHRTKRRAHKEGSDVSVTVFRVIFRPHTLTNTTPFGARDTENRSGNDDGLFSNSIAPRSFHSKDRYRKTACGVQVYDARRRCLITDRTLNDILFSATARLPLRRVPHSRFHSACNLLLQLINLCCSYLFPCINLHEVTKRNIRPQ